MRLWSSPLKYGSSHSATGEVEPVVVPGAWHVWQWAQLVQGVLVQMTAQACVS